MLTVRLARGVDARSLARLAVAEFLGVPEADVALGREALGRPIVLGAEGVHVSISHSHGLAAVVVTTAGPVGVDVETVRPLPAPDLARRWFDPVEAEWVGERPGDFLHLWTQKEAVGKALGIGLRHGGLRRRMPLPPTGERLAPIAEPSTVAVGSVRHGDEVVAVACESAELDGASIRVLSDPAR